MRTRARHMGCSAATFVAAASTAAIAISPASAQAADAQVQIDSFDLGPQHLTPDATSGKTLRSPARRGTKGWIALHRPDGELVYIKLDQIVFVMSTKDTGAAERARSMVQLLNGYSDVREGVEEVMQTIENDGLLAKDARRSGGGKYILIPPQKVERNRTIPMGEITFALHRTTSTQLTPCSAFVFGGGT